VRKVRKEGDLIPLSGKEIEWIKAAVKILIRRTGELANIKSAQTNHGRFAEDVITVSGKCREQF
jgi:hypothetical protein